ncbi:hypothetical protein [Pseudobacillus badius]|uniref:hypothetical protein n=1 Tax=Bacillus badius TaxID=1455 RepID=UPI0007B3560C|nr:hypothetical protein [Bacillus badius]KZR60377.1 hypothetical protein A3781_09400 [Bacillus badius]
MKVKFHLNNGMVVTSEVPDYKADSIAAMINDQSKFSVLVGDFVIAKNMIAYITPEVSVTDPNVQLFLQSREIINEYVESYSAEEIAAKVNDQRSAVFAIGNTIVSRNLFGYAAPITN